MTGSFHKQSRGVASARPTVGRTKSNILIEALDCNIFKVWACWPALATSPVHPLSRIVKVLSSCLASSKPNSARPRIPYDKQVKGITACHRGVRQPTTDRVLLNALKWVVMLVATSKHRSYIVLASQATSATCFGFKRRSTLCGVSESRTQ